MSEEKPVHKLKTGFTFWYLNKKKGGSETYEESIKKMCTFDSVETFWSNYSHFTRPGDLPTSINYHLFREGIMPLWEDPNNAKGGKWMLRLRKGHANRAWEDVILAVIGDIFQMDEEICGVVLVTKQQEDILSVWNRNAHNRTIQLKIRDTLKRILNITNNAALEYRPHDQAIKNLHRQESQHQQSNQQQQSHSHSSHTNNTQSHTT